MKLQEYKLPVLIKKWSFKTLPSENKYVAGLLKLIKEMGATKIAILHQGANYGTVFNGVVEKTAPEMGLKVVAVEAYGLNDTAMTP